MKKSLYLMTAIALSLSVIATPIKSVHAVVCGIPCILQAGGQAVQDGASYVENLYNGVKQSALDIYSQAGTWLEKYLKNGFSGLNTESQQQPVKTQRITAPNLAAKVSGGRGYSMPVTIRNEQGQKVTVDAAAVARNPSASIDEKAKAKQQELLSTHGTMQGKQIEQSQKNYISQQDAINVMAQALVLKSALKDLEQINVNLDEIQSAIVPYTLPSAAAMTNQSDLQPTVTSSQKGERSVTSSLRDNLTVRLLWDSLLTMQQQVMALRLKTMALNGISGMGQVSNPVQVQIIDKNTQDGGEAIDATRK